MQIELLITLSVPVKCHVKRNLVLQARVRNTATLQIHGGSVVNHAEKGKKNLLLLQISV